MTESASRWLCTAAALPFIGWGALAETLALADWDLLTVGGSSFFFFFVFACLLVDGGRFPIGKSLPGDILLVALGMLVWVAGAVVPYLLSVHIGPLSVAIYAAVIASSYVATLFASSWLLRYVAKLISMVFAVAAVAAAGVMIGITLFEGGTAASSLNQLPSTYSRIAAVLLVFLAPIGFLAALRLFTKENPHRQDH